MKWYMLAGMVVLLVGSNRSDLTGGKHRPRTGFRRTWYNTFGLFPTRFVGTPLTQSPLPSPSVQPLTDNNRRLWSLYHYRTLLVLYLQIHAHFLFVDILRRGKMFNCYARLLGASVGRDADVATMYFTDHDLVSKRVGWIFETSKL